MAEFVVGDAGVAEGDIGLVSALLQGDGYDRLSALGAFGHPGELDDTQALQSWRSGRNGARRGLRA